MIRKICVNLTLLLSISCLLTLPYNLNAQENIRNAYQEKFSNVLLIIHYNHPYYDSIEFIRNLYSPMFKNIVFYGEKSHPQVYKVQTHYGYFLHQVLEHALTQYPNCDGYLVLQDDCILNVWNYLSRDLNKIWFASKPNEQQERFVSVRNVNGSVAGHQSWHWWNMSFNAVWKAHTKFNPQELDNLRKNVGVNSIPGIWCDFFYIPAKHRNSALRLNSLLHNVFCEIAIPTMLCSLDLIEDWEQLHMDWGHSHFTIGTYPTNVDWVHPIKFSSKENRDMVTHIFATHTNIQG